MLGVDIRTFLVIFAVLPPLEPPPDRLDFCKFFWKKNAQLAYCSLSLSFSQSIKVVEGLGAERERKGETAKRCG